MTGIKNERDLHTPKQRYIFVGILLALIASAAHAEDGFTIPTTTYVDRIVGALRNDSVLTTGDQTISGIKIFNSPIKIAGTIDDTTNDTTVATTQWATNKLNSARSTVRVGQNSDEFTNIWVE